MLTIEETTQATARNCLAILLWTSASARPLCGTHRSELGASRVQSILAASSLALLKRHGLPYSEGIIEVMYKEWSRHDLVRRHAGRNRRSPA